MQQEFDPQPPHGENNHMPINYADMMGATSLTAQDLDALSFGNLLILENPKNRIAVAGFLEEVEFPLIRLVHYNPLKPIAKGFERHNWFAGQRIYSLSGISHITVVDANKLETAPVHNGGFRSPSLDAIIYCVPKKIDNCGAVAGYVKKMSYNDRKLMVHIAYENPLKPHSRNARRADTTGDKDVNLLEFEKYAFILPNRSIQAENDDEDSE